MGVTIIRESINGSCERPDDPKEQRNLEFVIFVEVENHAEKKASIESDDVVLSIKSKTGRLLIVEPANSLNGNYEGIKIQAGVRKCVKMLFYVHSSLYGDLSRQSHEFNLEIGDASVNFTRENNQMLSAFS